MTQTGKPRFPAGDSFTLVFDVVEPTGEPISLVGSTIVWSLRLDESIDEIPLLTKAIGTGLTLDPIVTNRFRVQLDPLDTIDLPPRDYWQKSVITFNGVTVSTVGRSWLTILP